MSKRLFVVGKIGPAFKRDEMKVNEVGYSKDVFDSLLSTALAVLIAAIGAGGLVLIIACVEAWIMKGKA